MAMVARMWKLAMVAMVVALVAECGSAQIRPSVPAYRLAPYSVTINAGKSSVPVQVLRTQRYVLSLEGNPCAITIRRLSPNRVGHLVWTANYFVGSVAGATKCTLKLTTAAGLQLFALYRGKTTMIWSFNVVWAKITRMELESKLDSGDLQLQTATGMPVFYSYRSKEFVILPGQKLSFAEALVAPNAFFTDATWQVLFSGNHYFLKVEMGDLRLFSSFGKTQKQYWSLKKSGLAGNAFLRTATHAGIVPGVGGIGLYDASSKLLWASGRIRNAQSNALNTYFGVDPDGNLRSYFLQNGQTFWKRDFEAIRNLCDFPNSCGPYGVCSNGKCSCLPGWVPIKPKDLTQGCRRAIPFTKCIPGSKVKPRYLSYAGYDTVFNQFKPASQVYPFPEAGICEFACSLTCNCAGFFFDFTKSPGLCYLWDELRTLKKVSNSKKSVHIRI